MAESITELTPVTYQPGRLPGLFREILSSGGLPTYM
ncbi:hypothetical protein LEP1GSC195_0654, partial [Leptospira wolbachii serovar Codice str. CDC]